MISTFQSEIKVDKNIVPLLSKSTYQKSFSDAIRELVSNAYDADALTVRIDVNFLSKKITIEDDGNGMSQKDFDKFITIAKKKSETELTKKYKRNRIGQFGIGFLAIFPFCEELRITSTAENSDEVLTAIIPTKDFFEIDLNRNNSFQSEVLNYKENYIDEIKITGTIINQPSERLKHYTKIDLIKPTYVFTNYFKKYDTHKRSSIIGWSPIDRFKWELQEDLPLEYEKESENEQFMKYKEKIGLSVFLNGVKLFRNPLSKFTLQKGNLNVSGFDYKYILSTNYESVLPLEARGIKIRVNNVGIGPRTDFFLKRDRGFSRLHWITGEIHISEMIKDNLNLNRNAFISNPIVDELFESFAEILRKKAYEVEKISEAEKDLMNLTNERKASKVRPKQEIANVNIGKLINAGFEVKKTNNLKDVPVKIDKSNKIVYVGDLESYTQDKIRVDKKDYDIIYNSWDIYQNPCRFISEYRIEVNINYPLFKSKTYGNLFKKILILILISQKNNKSSEDMIRAILDSLNSDFSEFI